MKRDDDMAGKRAGSGMEKPEPDLGSAAQYTKEQLAESGYYRSRRDLVHALLENGRVYTVSEADEVIHEFMKGKVSLC